jgi:lipopolysaccharide transport system ATP-binding protein
MESAAIELINVSKKYRIFRQRHQTLKEFILKRKRGEWDDLWALKNVSLQIQKGEFFGIVGPNGAGKSTLLKLIARTAIPDEGYVITRGSVQGLLELGAGFQGEYTGEENIYLYGALVGLKKSYIKEKFNDIVEFSGLGDFIYNPVKTYSSGMYVRLAFSVVAHISPDILLIDEVLTAGDEAFQQKCMLRINELRERGTTIVLVSHDLSRVSELCTRAAWLQQGQFKVVGDPVEVVKAYRDAVESMQPAVT